MSDAVPAPSLPEPIRDGFPDGAAFHRFTPPGQDAAMAYVEAGGGPPVLFVHGNPTWSWMYRGAMAAVAGSHRAIAVDHVGMGRSDKPQEYAYRLDRHAENLLALVRHLDLNDVTLVVHDWGGPIGLLAATREPERFLKLVISNTAAFRSERMPWRIGLARSPIGGALLRGANLFLRGLVTKCVVDPANISPAARRGYLWPYGNWADRVAVHRFVQDVPVGPRHPSFPHLVELEEGLVTLKDKPTLLLWGDRDWCFGPPFLKEFQQRMPWADTVALPAGHLLMEDEPERYQNALLRFCESDPGHAA